MMQVISGHCCQHGDWTGPGMCPKCPKMTVSLPPSFEEGFRAGAEAMQAAAVAMLERAQQPAAALGVSLMKLPEPLK